MNLIKEKVREYEIILKKQAHKKKLKMILIGENNPKIFFDSGPEHQMVFCINLWAQEQR